ncbi:MAG: methyltransferase domain-containing protein [Flavobacteriaceae bacterium]|nr:methyltransferase domain-containing protein [Flavobacteriaceae bacterium]
MGFVINTKHRTNQIELMDDLAMSGELLRKTLDQIAKINQWLGGNNITLNGLKKILKNKPKNKTVTIIDLGCGNGDMLREIANYGRKEGYNFNLIGVDANEYTVNYAKKKSQNYTEISYLQQDVFSDKFKNLDYDIVLSTLFLHHFTENEIIYLLTSVLKKAKLGVIINDLHRHPMAYYLFKLLCLTIQNPMVKQDGLISILRGFKRLELERISEKLKYKSNIQWKWAFRYQWILTKQIANSQ